MSEILLTIMTDNSGAGAAVGSGDTPPIFGYLEAIQYAYGSAPATTTITITENDTSRAILAIPAGNTAGVAYVRAPAVNLSNAAIAGSWARIYLHNHSLHAAVSLANNANVLTVRFIFNDVGW
jgi:hypothetical protein